MYLSIRKFSNVTSPEIVINKVQAELTPIMRDLPGFVAYYGTKFDDGDLGSVSIFENKANADSAAERALEWIKNNLADHLTSDPMVLHGDVLFGSAGKTLAMRG